ncbi:MAG: hypothetical protein ACYS1C_12270, partial [Planctomycetota bacterium]
MTAEDGGNHEGGRIKGAGCLALAAAVAILLVGLGAVCCHLYDRHWRRKFEAKVADLRAAGRPVTWQDLLAGRAELPDEENSALVMLEAIREMADPPYEYGEEAVEWLASDREVGVRFSPELHRILSSGVSANARALELVHEAAELPGGVFPIDGASDPLDYYAEHTGAIRQAARLCALEAALHAEAGRPDAAYRSLRAGLRMAASMGSPMWQEAYSRWSLGWTAVEGLEQTLGLCELDAPELGSLREELARERDAVPLKAVLNHHTAFQHYAFTALTADELGDSLRMSSSWPGRVLLRAYRWIPGRHWKDA